MRILTATALCLALLPAAAHARSKSEPIDNPTVQLSTKASASQVKKGVKMAVLNRKWDITNEKAPARMKPTPNAEANTPIVQRPSATSGMIRPLTN